MRYVKVLFTNIQKQYNMLKISLLFKKMTNFAGKTWEFLELRSRNFQGIVFLWTPMYRDFQICISVPLKVTWGLISTWLKNRKKRFTIFLQDNPNDIKIHGQESTSIKIFIKITSLHISIYPGEFSLIQMTLLMPWITTKDFYWGTVKKQSSGSVL